MKQYSHAFLAFMAIKRLEQIKLGKQNRGYADKLIKWFKDNKDGVIRGAWYPDSVIKDNANSHVLKITPSDDATRKFRTLPTTYMNYAHGKTSPVRKQSFVIDPNDNLPDRCESIAESVIDLLKIQEREEKGSPVSPTDNQIALLLFMLSHYIADAHMPFHCDNRKFSDGADIHAKMEKEWEGMIEHCYLIDEKNDRFFYDQNGYPAEVVNLNTDEKYKKSFLKTANHELGIRDFIIGWGGTNNNVWDFMSAICQHSYLLSYCFIPPEYNYASLTTRNWKSLGSVSFEKVSEAVFLDAIDSIARVWFRV
ncbi:hypothetical protein ACFLT7_07210 [candidate division KSB1 bacterium]